MRTDIRCWENLVARIISTARRFSEDFYIYISIYISMSINPPYTLSKFANFGTQEPWVARLMVGIPEMMTFLPDAVQEEAKIRLFEVTKEIGAAFEALRRFRELAQTADPALIDMNSARTNLYDHLWKAYKDRLIALVAVLGHDIVFLFQGFDQGGQRRFDERFNSFVLQNPSLAPLLQQLKQYRETWHKMLKEERDSDQHRAERMQAGNKSTPRLQSLQDAETMFTNVWMTIEVILVEMIAVTLPASFCILDIPEAERNPERPVRYRLGMIQPSNQ